ncbi:MAG: hypothetical protein ACFFGZ_10305 [Candidatus Thorarchaeota archaeon]
MNFRVLPQVDNITHGTTWKDHSNSLERNRTQLPVFDLTSNLPTSHCHVTFRMVAKSQSKDTFAAFL